MKFESMGNNQEEVAPQEVSVLDNKDIGDQKIIALIESAKTAEELVMNLEVYQNETGVSPKIFDSEFGVNRVIDVAHLKSALNSIQVAGKDQKGAKLLEYLSHDEPGEEIANKLYSLLGERKPGESDKEEGETLLQNPQSLDDVARAVRALSENGRIYLNLRRSWIPTDIIVQGILEGRGMDVEDSRIQDAVRKVSERKQ